MLLSNFATGFQSNYSQTQNMLGSGANNFTCQLANFAAANSTCHYSGAGSGPYVLVGGSDVAPTYNDYAVDYSILGNSLLKSIATAASWSKVGGNTLTTQWQNMSDSAITVKEVALAYKWTTNNPNKPEYTFIVARKVLDTPVVIQPNEIYAFTYRLKFN